MRHYPRSLAAALLCLAIVGCAAGGALTGTPTGSPAAAPSATPAPSASSTPRAPSPTASASQAAAGGEIGCDLGGHDSAYHIHTLVAVKVDGSLYAPPANIGIGSCMYWVHTHDADGIVHVEAPANVSPTLGDFLDLWEGSYPGDQLLVKAREAIAAGEVTVDDQPISTDPLELPLADEMRVILGS